jgi:hypothetical protein
MLMSHFSHLVSTQASSAPKTHNLEPHTTSFMNCPDEKCARRQREICNLQVQRTLRRGQRGGIFRRKLSGRKPIDNVVTGDTFRRGGPSLVYAKFIESLRSAAREDTPPSEKYPESRLMPESRERCSARKQFLCGFAIITRPRNINFGLSPDIHDMQQLICSIFRLVVTLWTGNIASDIRLDGLVAQPEKRCSVILDRA